LGGPAVGVSASSQQERYVPATEQLVVELLVDDLGFLFVRRDETFAELSWENHLFFLDATKPSPDVGAAAANLGIMVADVNEYWQRVQGSEARVLKLIGDRYYGLRDFTSADPDGFGRRASRNSRRLDRAEREHLSAFVSFDPRGKASVIALTVADDLGMVVLRILEHGAFAFELYELEVRSRSSVGLGDVVNAVGADFDA